MNIKEIIIVPKLSKYQYDLVKYRLNHRQLIDKYSVEGVDHELIWESHQAQHRVLKTIAEHIPKDSFIERSELTKSKLKSAKLVVSVGGDNHFIFVSHYCDDQLMIGLNSDPERSEGVLNSFEIGSFISFLSDLKSDNFDVEEWTRLEVNLNGRRLKKLALSEVYIGAKRSVDMSRYLITLGNKSEIQKSSGVIIATGSGITGWYNSAIRHQVITPEIIKPSDRQADFIVREIYIGRLSQPKIVKGSIGVDEELQFDSLVNRSGIIGIDGLAVYPFNRGSMAKIRVSDRPLRVIKKSD